MKQSADRPSNFGRRKRRRRDLIKQRLKKVVVPLIDHGDINGCSLQILHGLKSAETRADNDDAMSASRPRTGGLDRHQTKAPCPRRMSASRCGTLAGSRRVMLLNPAADFV